MDTTLLKGLTVLEALIRSERPRGVSEFAAELRLSKSNVHRVLSTLQTAGFVTQISEASTYVPTLKAWELGSVIYSGLDIIRVARPHLVRLASLTRETVHLSVLDGLEVVYIDKIDSPEPVRAYSIVGGRAPAHCVATGKVLLAYADLGAVLASDGAFQPYTTKTISGLRDVMASGSDIRAKGFAVNWGEWREQVRGVAAPVRDSNATVQAAVGISGPAERMTRSRISETRQNILEAAEHISKGLGYQAKPERGQRRA